MKIIYVTVLIGLLCTLCCCKNKGLYSPDELKIVSIPEIKDTLRANKIQDSDLLPQCVLCADSYMFVQSRSNESLIKVLDAHNDSLISAFGTIGQGHNELLRPFYACYFQKNVKGNLCLLVPTSDYQTYVINVYESLNKGICSIDTIYKDSDKEPMARTFFLDGGKKKLSHKGFWFDGDARDNENIRTPELNVIADGNVKRMSAFPKTMKADKNLVVLMYRSVLTLNPAGTKLVEVYNAHNTMNIYDVISGKVLGVRFGEEVCLDEIESEYSGFTFHEAIKKLKIYNLVCCASNDYIFVTHESKLTIAESDDMEKYSLSLLVFDWNGNCLANFALKENLVSIAYNDVCKKLYGLDYKDNLYSYEIGELLSLYEKTNRD